MESIRNPLFTGLMSCSSFAPGCQVQLTLQRHDDHCIETRLVGFNTAMSLVLLAREQDPEGLPSYADLSLAVTWGGTNWDTLISVGAAPIKFGARWQCGQCPADARRTYNSLQAFWDSELFQPMRAWIDVKLLPANVLLLKRSRDGGLTWAELSASIDASAFRDPYLFAVLPIHAEE